MFFLRNHTTLGRAVRQRRANAPAIDKIAAPNSSRLNRQSQSKRPSRWWFEGPASSPGCSTPGRSRTALVERRSETQFARPASGERNLIRFWAKQAQSWQMRPGAAALPLKSIENRHRQREDCPKWSRLRQWNPDSDSSRKPSHSLRPTRRGRVGSRRRCSKTRLQHKPSPPPAPTSRPRCPLRDSRRSPRPAPGQPQQGWS